MTDEETPQTPHVFVRGEGGSVFKLDIPLHETIEERLRKGYLTRVADADGNPYVDWADNIPSLPTSRPAINAVKSEWVGWAVAQGMIPDDAEFLTKQDLIEKFGANASEPIVAILPGMPAPDAVESVVADVTPDDAEPASDEVTEAPAEAPEQ